MSSFSSDNKSNLQYPPEQRQNESQDKLCILKKTILGKEIKKRRKWKRSTRGLFFVIKDHLAEMKDIGKLLRFKVFRELVGWLGFMAYQPL